MKVKCMKEWKLEKEKVTDRKNKMKVELQKRVKERWIKESECKNKRKVEESYSPLHSDSCLALT